MHYPRLAASRVITALACLLVAQSPGCRPTPVQARANTAIAEIQSVKTRKTERLTEGQTAPDMTWFDSHLSRTMRLSQLRGKPVVLFFGSCTCGPFRLSVKMIEQLKVQYGKQFHAFVVYADEAHPDRGDSEVTRNPKTHADRLLAAQELVQNAQLTLPVLVDTQDNQAAKAFEVEPSRVYILDAAGKVAYRSGTAPASNMAMPVAGVLNSLLTGPSGIEVQ